jgi:AcrR family transcriptional regulator
LVKYHFATKDALWREAVRFLFDRMNAEIRQAPRAPFGEDPERAFADMIRALVRYNARHPEHARLMVLESVRDSERIRWAAETLVRRQHAAVGPFVEAAIAHGFLPDLPRHELVTMVNALCHITFTLEPMVRHSWSVEVTSEEAIEAHVRAVLLLLGRSPLAPH